MFNKNAFYLIPIFIAITAQTAKPVLKGSVNQSSRLNQGLNREDLNGFSTNGSNGFNSSGGNGFNSSINNNQSDFSSITPSFSYSNANVPKTSLESKLENFENANMNPPHLNGDIEDTQGMKLAWDSWHKRVADEVYRRFQLMSKMAYNNGQPIEAYVTYSVTNTGRIVNAKISKPSPDQRFDKMLLLVINSLDGETQILQFPQGSKRKLVEKGGLFTQNMGNEGYRYTTGDTESVK